MHFLYNKLVKLQKINVDSRMRNSERQPAEVTVYGCIQKAVSWKHVANQVGISGVF